MPGQDIRYVVRADSNIQQTFRQDEAAAQSLERSIAGVSSELKTMAAAAGIAFSVREAISIGKEWLQGAADYETAMIRIKNASESAAEGVKNQLFIKDATEKFKTDLQSSADAYGNFLLKIKNANLGSDLERHLYENIMTISKVSALPENEINATVRNIGIMLGEGILEARHLRQLSYVHPQIVPYLAQAMGLRDNQKDAFSSILKSADDDHTASQKLSLLMSGGKLTKAAIDPRVLLTAIENYKNAVAGGLPEVLNSTQSNLNELHNEWLKFKNDLVLDNKQEILDFFHELQKGIKWLVEHEKDIVSYAKLFANIAEVYIAAKIAIGGLQLAQQTWLAFQQGLAGTVTTQTAAYNSQALAVTELTAAIERLNFVQNAQNASFLTTAGGMTVANTVGNRYALSAAAVGGEEGAAAGVAGGVGGGLLAGGGATLVGGAILVALAAGSIVAITEALRDKHPNHFSQNDYNTMYHSDHPEDVLPKFNAWSKKQFEGWDKKGEAIWGTSLGLQRDSTNMAHLPQGQLDIINKLQQTYPNPTFNPNASPTVNKPGSPAPLFKAPEDKIKGQHIVTYNITIGKMIGQEIGTQKNGASEKEVQISAKHLSRLLNSVANDAELHDGD